MELGITLYLQSILLLCIDVVNIIHVVIPIASSCKDTALQPIVM